MNLDKIISKTKKETIELRRDFHRHPELGMQEFRTGDKVAAYLTSCGLEVSRLNITGVSGFLKGAEPGPTLLMRADMDALPVHEETSVPFKSLVDGVMHACGHDAHTAMLMVAAKILAGLRKQLKGNIKFVFEPNEENMGARAMIDMGVMESPRVDACMGLHAWNQIPKGHLGISSGPIMAGMAHFDLLIKGKGGHTATPQSAVDPILAAAAIVQGVQVIQTREIDVLKQPTLIMFGKIQGGTASNVIPESVMLSGTLRYFFEGDEDNPDNPKNRFERVVSSICKTHRADYELTYPYGHPTLINHKELSVLVADTAVNDIKEPVEIVPLITLAGEDFSEFALRAPSIFFFLGAGKAKEKIFPHHHPRFDIDEDALQIGVEMLVRTALGFFEKANFFSFMK